MNTEITLTVWNASIGNLGFMSDVWLGIFFLSFFTLDLCSSQFSFVSTRFSSLIFDSFLSSHTVLSLLCNINRHAARNDYQFLSCSSGLLLFVNSAHESLKFVLNGIKLMDLNKYF